MRKALFTLTALLAMMFAGTCLRAQEVTITLYPGWTWISYPNAEVLDINTALGDFVPVEGDIIQSQFSNSKFIRGRWVGGLTHFIPGWGYKYYSNRSEVVSFVFANSIPQSQVIVTTSEPLLITAVSAMGGGEVTTDDGIFILAKGICWATHEDPTTNEDASIDAGSGIGSFSASMTGLNVATTYYVRAYAVTADGTTYGDQKTFTTRNGIPTVTTDTVTSITGVTAICSGTVTDNGGLNVTARGVCWSTSQNPTVSDSHTMNGTGLGSFTSSITGLSISTTYYVRAYASTSQGTAYGEEVSFTTRDGIPTVTTAEVTNITAIDAVCGGRVTDDCGLEVTARGVCWSTSPNPTLDDSHTTNSNGIGSFTSSIIGLSISTTYYVRAYATTSAGTGYGEQVSFTTRNGIPTVTTAEVTNITAIDAVCGGRVTDDCGLEVTARGVCWSTSPNPTLDDSHTTNESGMGSFSSSITGLSISTTYYVRAYATTSAGTGYGEQVSFTTRNGIPTVTTVEVTNIGSGCAYSGGNIADDGGLAITARGVCWSTSLAPSITDSHTIDGNGTGSFTSFIPALSCNTTYYVRAYATNSFVTVYGNQLSFTTTNDEYAYVDLGLPSGLLWSTCNVGANVPEDYGDYFAWGETQPKDTYNWGTYIYSSDWDQLTKYCNDANSGYNGFTDDLTVLLPEDDAATANWGSGWRMPTEAEWQELLDNTTCTWTTQNGVNGRLFTASNGNSLFLPAAGYRYYSSLDDPGGLGGYWSSSLETDQSDYAWCFYFYSDNYDLGGSDRYCGQSVRAVRSGQSLQSYTITVSVSPNDGGSVSGDGTYEQGQSCTVTATANSGYVFTNWTENGEVVSTDATYTFTVQADRALVANFTAQTTAPTGAIDGKFTINANGNQVYFSQGNLQYIGSAATPYWKFADNQWDYLGTTTGQNSTNQNVDRDLFGWGTSGYNHGAVCYQPWSVSTGYTDYYAYGSDTYNLYDQTGQADWGYNPISNGGNQANQWRTLTKPEWVYVFNTRTTNSGIRYAKAKVNNVNGVILLPDDWSTTYYTLSNTNSTDASFSSNTITASQWGTLEQHGAVFLPAAGYRVGTSVGNVGSYGIYWSASYCDSYGAFGVYFRGSNFSTDSGNGRYYSQSVRLVADSEN